MFTQRILKVTVPNTSYETYFAGYVALSEYFEDKGIDIEYSDKEPTFYNPVNELTYYIQEIETIR